MENEEKHPHGTERYKLVTNLTITRETWQSYGGERNEPTKGYWQANMGNERLSVNEELDLGALDFLGVMKVLGRLHDSLQQIKHNRHYGATGEMVYEVHEPDSKCGCPMEGFKHGGPHHKSHYGVPAETLNHPGSDRWTGGDRKDEDVQHKSNYGVYPEGHHDIGIGKCSCGAVYPDDHNDLPLKG